VLFHIDDANAGRQVACRACGNPIRIPGTALKPSLWFYTRDRKPLGPVTFEELQERARARELLPRELVWQEGMARWVEARSVEGLYPVPPPLPPPVPIDSPTKTEETVLRVSEADDAVHSIEIIEDEPIASPIAVEPETPLQVTPELAEAAAPPKMGSPTPAHPDNWDVVANRPAATEEPIQVEPEFTVDFAAATAPPVRRAEPPPTVNLAFPTEVAVEQPAIPQDIELTPVEPKLELGEPDDFGPPKPYGIAAWSGAAPAEVVAVPESPVSMPEAYDVQGVSRPTTAQETAIAAAPVEAGAPPPMAIPVSPAEQRPRRETEEEQRERLRQEYRQERQSWTSVRSGIGMIYLAQAFWFAVIAGTVIINTMIAVFTGASTSEAQESGTGSAVTTVLLIVLALGVDTISAVGMVYCLKVPENAGSRALAIVAVVLTGIALFGSFVAAFVPLLQFVVVGIGFARWVAFLFFLQTVAHFFEAHFIMKSIERLLVLLVFTVGIGVVLWFGMAYLKATLGKSGDTAAVLTVILATLCTSLPMLGLLGLCTMRYLHVMRDTAAIIDQKLYRG
jgi:hypothetical protein